MDETRINPEVLPPEGASVDRLTDTIGNTISRVAEKVGDTVEKITNSMVDSAEGVADMAHNQVRAASRLAQARAGFRFKEILEESAIKHLEEIALRREALENKLAALPENSSTRKFISRSLEALDRDEEHLLATATEVSNNGVLALESAPAEEPRAVEQTQSIALRDPSMPDEEEIANIPPRPPRPGIGSTNVGGRGIG